MGYSKEAERQNKVLGDLLAGKTPEKRVMVGYDGKKEKSGDKISHLSDVMKEARMPWFCPKCKKVMKKRLDNKFYMKLGHCFDCQITFIKDQIQAITEWKEMKGPEFYNNVGVNYPELEKEKWDIDMKKVHKEADEAIEKFTETLEKLENEE